MWLLCRFHSIKIPAIFFIVEIVLDIVRKDKYLLPLITYTRSGLHDKVERNIFQSSKYNKGAPFKEVGNNNISQYNLAACVHISSLFTHKGRQKHFGWVWNRVLNGSYDLFIPICHWHFFCVNRLTIFSV